MEGINDTLNVTMQAIQYLSQAYTFCYLQLKDANIPLPAPDQVFGITTSAVSYILSHSPSFIQKMYSVLAQSVKESNFMTIFLLLVIVYIFYCSVVATFRWIYRLLFGFVRFTFLAALVVSIAYVVQQYLAGAALFPASGTSDKPGTKSFL
ncbi:hypothetical protein BDF21DRAFT_425529 [Thamnidium elegans]|uniref:Uncharacterized protein n=1 Tax=Thamnidium elegans TaxID=101142 RepID=A0A8H7SXG1_9FUNG|nr:hypothetical protein INT48_004263 [Thamnidium elegans]KAI8068794.1 hypothetical protein BDF21DRAFT_425529 [Thamnidium elegans]